VSKLKGLLNQTIIAINKGEPMARQFYSVVGFCFGFVVLISSFVMADDIKAASKITHVTIYPGAALVTREAQVDVSAGDHTVLFENIVPQIDENTLTVKGQGTAEVKIFGASIKTEYLTQSSDERVKTLQSQIESAEDEIALQKNKQEVLKKQKEYLDSVKLFAAAQIPKDLVTKTPTVTDLEQLGAYIGKSFAEALVQDEEIRLKLRDLDRKKEALNRQLEELNAGSQHVKRSIAVDIQGVRAGKLTVMVSYLVNGVNWEPLYDARVNFAKNQVDLSLFGLISQSSGEDWQEVTLTISTARPSIGGMMPELSSWTLRPWQPPVAMRRQAMAKASLSMESLGGANYAMADKKEDVLNAVPQAPQELEAKTAYAQSEEKGVTAVFKITKAVSIKSDGSKQRIPITALNLPASFEYASTPKLTTYAYLRSEVENNQSSVLLPGRVNVFLDGDYVGSSVIAKAIGNKEKFDLYLGADEGVTVKRELVEQKSDDVLFGSIPSPNRTDRYSYKIAIENYKNKAITVNVFDNLPISQDEKIKVKDVKYSVEPSHKDYKDRKGVVLWNIKLNPQEKKEITYSFAVERPRNLTIEGL
jgi:uncharacterized protein (TIGR02231 family)